ncbi:MAG: hypothetical protein ACRD16_05300 [Thermoanaerobaculia bacterium]
MKKIFATALLLVLAAGMAAAAEKTQNSIGVVKEYSAAEHAFSVEEDGGRTVRFVWKKETRFNGVVSTGARVTVRYTPQPDGQNLAQTVGVLK